MGQGNKAECLARHTGGAWTAWGAYMRDDPNDLACMEQVGFPADAYPSVAHVVTEQVELGAIREVAQWYLEK